MDPAEPKGLDPPSSSGRIFEDSTEPQAGIQYEGNAPVHASDQTSSPASHKTHFWSFPVGGGALNLTSGTQGESGHAGTSGGAGRTAVFPSLP